MPPKQTKGRRIHVGSNTEDPTVFGHGSSRTTSVTGHIFEEYPCGIQQRAGYPISHSSSKEQRQIWILNPQMLSASSSLGVLIHPLPKTPAYSPIYCSKFLILFHVSSILSTINKTIINPGYIISLYKGCSYLANIIIKFAYYSSS